MLEEVIIIADTHVLGTNPICRKDNLVEVQFDKWEEVIDQANTNKCSIIHAGDVMDSPHLGYAAFSKLVKLLKKLKYPMYCVFGGHDLWWHNPETYKSTPLYALMQSVKNVQLPDSDIFDYMHWNSDIEDNKNPILICHTAVVNEEIHWQKEEDFLYCDNTTFLNYKIVINGHWHKRSIFKHKGTLFIRPGSLVRIKANEDSFNTFPSYVWANLRTLEYEIIPLTCAQEAEDVLSKDHLELSKEKKEILHSISDFVDQLKYLNKNKNVTPFLDILFNLVIDQLDKSERKFIEEILISVLGRQKYYEQISENKRNTKDKIRTRRISTKGTEGFSSKRLLLKSIEE